MYTYSNNIKVSDNRTRNNQGNIFHRKKNIKSDKVSASDLIMIAEKNTYHFICC